MFNPERGRSESDSAAETSEEGEKEVTSDAQATIESRLGEKPLEEIAQCSGDIARALEFRIAEIALQGPDSSEKKESVDQYLEMWRNFSDNIHARLVSNDTWSPEDVETAIKGANAILNPEVTQEGEESARNIVKGLSEKYGHDWLSEENTGHELRDRFFNDLDMFLSSTDSSDIKHSTKVVEKTSRTDDPAEIRGFLEDNRDELSHLAIKTLESSIELKKSKIQE